MLRPGTEHLWTSCSTSLNPIIQTWPLSSALPLVGRRRTVLCSTGTPPASKKCGHSCTKSATPASTTPHIPVMSTCCKRKWRPGAGRKSWQKNTISSSTTSIYRIASTRTATGSTSAAPAPHAGQKGCNRAQYSTCASIANHRGALRIHDLAGHTGYASLQNKKPRLAWAWFLV